MNYSVSIAMTSCNGEKYIGTQIDTLLAQQLPPDEIIVCDDASTDGTAAILTDYESRGLIRLYRNEQRLGVTANFQQAVRLCKAGNLIALCDQDDYWCADKTAVSAALLQTIDPTRPGLVFSDLRLTNERLEETAPSFWKVLSIDPGQETLGSLLFGNIITGCTVMMNEEMKKTFLQIPASAGGMHDAWLGLIAFSFGDYRFVSRPLLQYRQHGGNVTFATNRKNTLAKRVAKNVGQWLSNKSYLAAEQSLAAAFYDLFAGRLLPEQKKIFAGFLALGKASFMEKKKTAIAARAYRRLL